MTDRIEFMRINAVEHRQSEQENEMETRYAVKSAKSGQMFAGFDDNSNAIWGSTNNAKAYATKLEAQAQASLFRRMGVRAQLKPEEVK